jgi:O-6-methylguanine DNA methyltransferase
VYVAFNHRGISFVTAAASREEFEERFRGFFHRPIYPADPGQTRLQARMAASLEGKKATLRFDLDGLPEFQRTVLEKALSIPRGEIRPYGWIAAEIGHPKAVRAVGTALARNPVPLFIPCHRVVRSDGYIGNYSLGGRNAKIGVLASEGVSVDEVEALARAGTRYYGSKTTRIYCFPTCRHARRVDQKYLMRFRSESDAKHAGYRPCKVCRPLAAA